MKAQRLTASGPAATSLAPGALSTAPAVSSPSPAATSLVPGALSTGKSRDMKREATRLIALDLDGTLLDSQKRISPRNRRALEAAAARGIHIVPTTGRFFDGMPECVRELPFVRYAVTVNGAAVFDRRENSTIVREELPVADCLAVLDILDRHDVIYNCYMDNWGWVSRNMVEGAERYMPDFYMKILADLITPVDDLRVFMAHRGSQAQKIICFSKDGPLLDGIRAEIARAVPGTALTFSCPQMLEVNAAGAHKGRALGLLSKHLGFGIGNVMAFGDGLNDLTMVRDAGLGVAMANAEPAVLAVAGMVTSSNDDDGVAAAIEKILL